jgi:hypothetical protein
MTLSNRCKVHVVLAAGAALFALTLGARSASASTAIAGDLDFAVPINSQLDSGAGFGIRLGKQLHAPLAVLTPELGFTYHGFSGLTAYRGVAGLRLGVGEIIRPGVFAHLGVGHLTAPSPAPSSTAFTYDAGAFLDFTLLPLLDIGAHAAYNHVNAKDPVGAFQWATVGVHAALIF